MSINDYTKAEGVSQLPSDETEKQLFIIEQLHEQMQADYARTGKKKTYHVVTFGCQMNARDSEKLAGILERIGYAETDTEDADFVIYNTCTVRENANLRVYGRLGQMKRTKQHHPDMLIALCGCMMQEPLVVDKIRKSYRHVDIIFGTHNIFKLAELIQTRLNTGKMVVDIWKDTNQIVEDLPNERKYSFKTGVNIMFGCNNFCSYCIVPYVRGRERSREPKDIIREIERDVADGVKEVMLLGQNVNSYGKNLENPISFAKLLQEIEKIEGLERIRFMTSHPKDLSDELIAVMGQSKKICRHLHLPLQSGSSRILKLMNRKYTKESYLDLVDRIRKGCPDISLTTDIIVGFPGETEEQHEELKAFVDEMEFDRLGVFTYSPEEDTPAAEMPDQIPEEVKEDRQAEIMELQQEIAFAQAEDMIGEEVLVMIEGKVADENAYVGRTYKDAPGVDGLIFINTDEELMSGDFARVKVTGAVEYDLIGELL